MARIAGGLFVHSYTSRGERGPDADTPRTRRSRCSGGCGRRSHGSERRHRRANRRSGHVGGDRDARQDERLRLERAGRRGGSRRRQVGRSEADQVTNVGYDNTESVLRQLAGKKPGLLISHASGYDTIARAHRAADGRPDDHLRRDEEPRQGQGRRDHDLGQPGRLPRRHPRRQDDEVRHRRHRHLGLRHQLVPDGRRLRRRRAQRLPVRQDRLRDDRPRRLRRRCRWQARRHQRDRTRAPT